MAEHNKSGTGRAVNQLWSEAGESEKKLIKSPPVFPPRANVLAAHVLKLRAPAITRKMIRSMRHQLAKLCPIPQTAAKHVIW